MKAKTRVTSPLVCLNQPAVNQESGCTVVQSTSDQSTSHAADTIKGILDEAAGMFRVYVGGPGFWRHVHTLAGIEKVVIHETFEMGVSGPQVVSFRVDGEMLTTEWTPPNR